MSLNNAPLRNMGTCLPSRLSSQPRLPIDPVGFNIFWLDGVHLKGLLAGQSVAIQDYLGKTWGFYGREARSYAHQGTQRLENSLCELYGVHLGASINDGKNSIAFWQDDWLFEQVARYRSNVVFATASFRVRHEYMFELWIDSRGLVFQSPSDAQSIVVGGYLDKWSHTVLKHKKGSSDIQIWVNGVDRGRLIIGANSIPSTLWASIYHSHLDFGFLRVATTAQGDPQELYKNAQGYLKSLGESF